MKPIILYKVNFDDNSKTLLDVVRYLYTKGIDIRAEQIVERDIPTQITPLPALMFQDQSILCGLDNIIAYYERLTHISQLRQKSQLFDQYNPDYRITLSYTHKYLKSIDHLL